MRKMMMLILTFVTTQSLAAGREPLVRDLTKSQFMSAFGTTAARLSGASVFTVTREEGIKAGGPFHKMDDSKPVDVFNSAPHRSRSARPYAVFFRSNKCVVYGAEDAIQTNVLNAGETYSVWSAEEDSLTILRESEGSIADYSQGIVLALAGGNFTLPDTLFVACKIGVNEPISNLEKALGGLFKINP